jgi:hypothetical protein
MLATIAVAFGQSRPQPIPEAAERRIVECFRQGEYALALDLISQRLEDAPNDYNTIYNGACANCLLGDADKCAAMLLRAVKAGFREFAFMRSDPDLSLVRDHPTYQAILEAADQVANQSTRSALEQWRDKYGTESYRYETDKKHRLVFATALDEYSHREMCEMLQTQADQMIATLFGKPQSYDVLIAVPTLRDGDRIFKGDDSVGGMYEHRLRRLVARDIGGSLRHEFFHALHYGHMERLGQSHALWIQEGLASLYEDYEISLSGQTITFLPNDRQFIVKNRARAGVLVQWSDLFEMSADQFMDKAPELYPQVRSIFEFVADKGNLNAWYEAYVDNFREDATGQRAFEIVFTAPIDQVERDWRQWVIGQPKVDLVIDADDAALGIRTAEKGANDGVLVTDVLPRSAASIGGLRRRDIVVSIDGRPTRSTSELRRIVASHKVGDVVDVKVRRGDEYFTATLTLRSLSAGM